MFDPLHKWLGIPPSEQPPNDYRLLGLANFESDPEVIDSAADRDLTFLHHLSSGEHGELAEDLANRISAARLRLLNPQKKAAYDAQLRRELQTEHADVDDVLRSLDSEEATAINVSDVLHLSSPTAPPQSGLSQPGLSRAEDSQQRSGPDARQPEMSQPVSNAPVAPATMPMASLAKSYKPTKRRRPRGNLLVWLVGVVPGLIVLGTLIYLIATGRLNLDQDKLERLGIPPEQASQLAGSSGNSASDQATPSEAVTNQADAVESNVALAPTGPSSSAPKATSSTGPNGSVNSSIPSDPTMTAGAENFATEPVGSRRSPARRGSNRSTTIAAEDSRSPPASPRLLGGVPELKERTPDGRWNIPDEQSVRQKQKTVRDLFVDEYEKAKTADEKIAVADQMQVAAIETDDDPAGRYALFTVALAIYKQEGDLDAALETTDMLAESFGGFNSLQRRHEVLREIALTPNSTMALVKEAGRLADDARSEGKIDVGLEACQTVRERLDRVPPEAQALLSDIEARLRSAQVLYGDYENAAMTLESNPENAEANAVVGRYFCFIEDRWDEGMPYLAAGSDAVLKQTATVDLQRRSGRASILDVADRWFDTIAQVDDGLEKNAIAKQSKRLYLVARQQASSLESRKIDKRIESLDAITGASPFTRLRELPSEQPIGSRRRTTKPRLRRLRPQVFDYRTYTRTPANAARAVGNVLTVGMGRRTSSGEAAAGIGLKDVGSIAVVCNASHPSLDQMYPTNQVAFIVDYETDAGYEKRVLINVGGNAPRSGQSVSSTQNPPWGTMRVPDQVLNYPSRSQYVFDIQDTAPANWTGAAWFSVYMRDAGSERALTATLQWQGRMVPREDD
ncbi:tetratricopeptide repeat protein [Roseiconus lacunae]|uniref:hypothetical protein n=1 Tax=Roseiconus lacunae TaxID=2605694 RepID=UPI001E4EAAE3|nr:hypothetical protein [Roseiconus lacunae]MCD0458444.1 hypothetical protein [Roseiconus lacunae]